MRLPELLAAVKAAVDAVPAFADLATPGLGVLLADDLLPAGRDLDTVVETVLGEPMPDDGGPPLRGLALIAYLAEGDLPGPTDDLRESSRLVISVEENYRVARASGGAGLTALEAMQHVKAALHNRFYADGDGDTLRYAGYTKDDSQRGLIAYDIEFSAITTE